MEELPLALPPSTRAHAEVPRLTIVTLCHGWVTSPNLGRIIAGDESAHKRRRSGIAAEYGFSPRRKDLLGSCGRGR